MSMVELSREEKDAQALRIKRYLADEFELEIGQFEAEFLLDFVIESLGPLLYNRGLADAAAAMARRVDEITEAIWALEQPES